jgi:hypothetical protein
MCYAIVIKSVVARINRSPRTSRIAQQNLAFFAPRTRTDSDFRLARSVIFTKLEYLILNHRQLTQQRATAAQLDARGNPR